VSLRFDVHVHTTFSPDGRDGLAAYAQRVDEGVADGIGFAEHWEFWPGSDACGFLDVEAYRREIEAYRGRGYRFYAGAEADWMPEYAPVIADHLARRPFDFVIGSVHNLPSAEISGRSLEKFSGDEAFGRILDEYHAQVTSSLAFEGFDVIGHVGVYARHFGPEFYEGQAWKKARIADLEDDLAQKLAASGKLLEVNTSGLFCARAETCAGRFLLERYRAYGGRRLTLASDAHGAADLRRGFGQAGALLADLGFTNLWLPWDPETPVPLAAYLD